MEGFSVELLECDQTEAWPWAGLSRASYSAWVLDLV